MHIIYVIMYAHFSKWHTYSFISHQRFSELLADRRLEVVFRFRPIALLNRSRVCASAKTK